MLVILAAVCFFLSIIGIAIAAEGNMSGIALVFAAVAGLVWVYRRDRCNDNERKQALVMRHKMRIEEIIAYANPDDFTMEIKGNGNWMLVFLSLFFAYAAFLPGLSSLFMTGFAVTMLLAGSVLLILEIGSIGKPVLRISNMGIQTALSPIISWADIEGIHIQAFTRHGWAISQSLVLQMPTLQQKLAQFAWGFRLLHPLRFGLAKQRVFATLKNTSEPPEVIDGIMRWLWKAHTGRDYFWSPNVPESFNRAMLEAYNAKRQLESIPEQDLERKLAALEKLASIHRVGAREVSD